MRHASLPFFLVAMSAAIAAAQTTPATPPSQVTPPSSQTPAPRPSQPNSSESGKRSHSGQARSSSPQAQPRSAQSAVTETRPDASYPHPSGQDSHPDQSAHTTRLAGAGSRKNNGTVENRGTKAADQSKQAHHLAERKAYTGASGSKADPGTACTTARPTRDGGIDCGTTGDSSTMGKVVTKPR